MTMNSSKKKGFFPHGSNAVKPMSVASCAKGLPRGSSMIGFLIFFGLVCFCAVLAICAERTRSTDRQRIEVIR